MSKCDKVKLSELIIQKTDIEQIVDMENEHYITLSLYGKGARERVIKDGKYPVPFTGYRVSEGQFIYSRIDARNGAYAIIGPELDGFVVSKDFPVFDINESKVLPHFLRRAVLSDAFINQVKNSSFGATNRMRIKEDIFADYSIPLPELSKQKEIVDILDRVETIINSRQQELQKLDDLIKARFVEMFGDPRSNPFEFDQRRLKDTCKVITGNTPSRAVSEYYGDVIEWIKTDNIVSGLINPTKATEFLSEKGMKVGRIVESDAILMACIAGSISSIGKVCIANRKVAFNQQINAIIPESYDIVFLYILFQMSKEYLVEDVNMALKGILSKSKLEEKEFIVPPMDFQKEFADFVKKVNKSKLLEARQAGFIAKYRPINIILSIG